MPIFYSALTLTGVNLLIRFLGTGFQIYLSGRIGASGIGLLQLTLSVLSLAMTFGIAGIRTSTMYLTAEELGRSGSSIPGILSGCFTYSLVCSFVVSALVYCLSPIIAGRWIGDHRALESVRLFCFFLPVTCLCAVMSGYYTAGNRIVSLAAVEVAEQFFSILVTLLMLRFYSGSNVARACTSVILGSCMGSCMTLLCLVLMEHPGHAPGLPSRSTRYRLLKTAVPLAAADDLKAGIGTAENLLIPLRLSLCSAITNPMAVYGMICGMVFPIMMFPAAILYGLADLLIPELARCNAAGSQKRISYLVVRSLRTAMLYGFLCAGILIILSNSLCLRFYGSIQASAYLQKFSLLVPMLYCDSITDAVTKGLGKQKICVRNNIITSALDVLLLYSLLPKFHVSGYFFSFLLCHLLNFILSIGLLIQTTHVKIRLYIPFFAAAAVAAGIFLTKFVDGTLLKIPVFFGVSLSIWVILHVVTKEDLFWLWGLVHKKRPASRQVV